MFSDELLVLLYFKQFNLDFILFSRTLRTILLICRLLNELLTGILNTIIALMALFYPDWSAQLLTVHGWLVEYFGILHFENYVLVRFILINIINYIFFDYFWWCNLLLGWNTMALGTFTIIPGNRSVLPQLLILLLSCEFNHWVKNGAVI